jgi:ketosteroid isomerase-like protein
VSLSADDIAAIQQLYARYNHAVDMGSPTAFAEVFTPDAVFVTDMGTYTGRDALLEFAGWFRGAMSTNVRHWTNNLVLEESGAGASGACYLVAFSVGDPAGPKPMASGLYDDRLVRTPEGWRFAARTIVMDKPAA